MDTDSVAPGQVWIMRGVKKNTCVIIGRKERVTGFGHTMAPGPLWILYTDPKGKASMTTISEQILNLFWDKLK